MIRRPRSAALLLAVWPLLAGWSFFDPFHKNVEQGNKDAEAGETDAALQKYDEAARVNPGSPIPDFNRGIALTRDGRVEEAADAFLGAAAAEDPQVAADELYNLGTAMLEAEQYEAAVEAYLRSLDLDPQDADARRNLEIALQRQQQQQQQQQDQQQQDQQDENDQDEEQNQDQQQPQDEQDDQQQEEAPPEDEPQDDEQEQEQEQQPQPEKMSREDAERLLNAVQSDELKVLEQLQDDEEEDAGGSKDDW